MSKNTVYTAYNDPAHGWIKVSIKELQELGIADKISGYSYMRGEMAYLEEDMDASTFIEAKGGKDSVIIKDSYSKTSSKIRSYASYISPDNAEYKELLDLRTRMMNCGRFTSAKNLRQIQNASLKDLQYWQGLYNF